MVWYTLFRPINGVIACVRNYGFYDVMLISAEPCLILSMENGYVQVHDVVDACAPL